MEELLQYLEDSYPEIVEDFSRIVQEDGDIFVDHLAEFIEDYRANS